MLEKKNSREVRNNIRTLNTITDRALQREINSENKEDLMEKSGFNYYDSEIDSYEESFKKVLEPDENFNEFLKRNYSTKIGKLIGMELGGPGVNFFKGIEWDIFKKTVGFTLKKLPEHAGQINHEVVEADVFSKIYKPFEFERSWTEILKWVKANGRPDFIIERMVGPLFSIRKPKFFLIILDRWYRILNEEGSMFIEVPKDFKESLTSKNRIDYEIVINFIKKKIEENGSDAMIKFGHNPSKNCYVILIKKKKGAPRTLGEFK